MNPTFKEKCQASNLIKEFRAIAPKGNVIVIMIRDVNRGVFGKIVSYFVMDIIISSNF
jgi:large-conductance mechanosensitive channel